MPISYRSAQNLIKRGDEEALRRALDEKLDPSSTNANGWTLLMLAAVEGSAALGRLLVERGADIAARNHRGDDALAIAEKRGATEFVDVLKDAAA